MTDERNDDEVLGRALSRAIETQSPNETPFERSRLGTAPARRGFPIWQTLGAAAALVLALAFGSWFTRPSDRGPVAASPTATVSATAAAPTASASLTPQARQQTVFVSRDGLPPMVQLANGGDPSASLEERIRMRVEALNNAVSGLSGTSLLADPRQFYVKSVKVQGDTATIDYSARFPAGGSSSDGALMQQIVYTATEEPTVLRVLVTENGKTMETGHLVWNKALTREDVTGYSAKVETEISDRGTGDVPADQVRLSTTFSVDTFSAGLARFVIQVDRTSGPLPQNFMPKFDAKLFGPSVDDQSGLRGKALLVLTVDGVDANLGLQQVDRSPLRSINSVRPSPPFGTTTSTTYQLKLDAQYPWRVFTLSNPARLVIDVGGYTSSVSERIAVYAPARMAPISGATIGTPPSVGRQFTLSGAARVFEANVVWRVKDSKQKVVAEGHTTASLGSSPVWGTFQTQITLPADVSGNVVLEVYEVSARDGSELGLVAIPLTSR